MINTVCKALINSSVGLRFMGNSSGKFQNMAGQFLHKVDTPTNKATFAMGCFWAPDSLFGATKGVIRTRVGYTGGTKVDPTYKSLGDHTEAIDIDFDPKEISYNNLLSIFWKHHDPTSPSTKQYSSFIYYHDDEQKALAEETMKAVTSEKKKPVLTKIIPASTFYNAEDYHQKYRLQQFRDLFPALGLKSVDDLINSHIAARLNGYLVGQGGVKQFDAEAEKLGITGEMTQVVRQYVVKNEGKGLFC